MLRKARPEDHPVPSLQVQASMETKRRPQKLSYSLLRVIYVGVEPGNNNEGIGIEFFI